MAVVKTSISCELQKAVEVQYLKGNLFSQDSQANEILVTVTDGGEAAVLSGTVTANVIRADGGTVAVTGGTITDNVVSVTLPAAAYYVPGLVSIIVKLTDDTVVTTLAAVVANVYESSTDTAVDPGTIIPDIQALISAIETAVASIPADYSTLWTTLAPAYSTSGTYAVGDYVTYDGGLYRCVSDIASGESWTAAHWTAAKVGPDISALKSAMNVSGAVWNIPIKIGKYYNGTLDATLATTDNANSVYTDVIDVSSVIGGKIKMQISSMGSGSRYTGFCDSNNKIKERYVASDSTLWVLNSTTGMYEAELEIKYPKFYYSNSSSIAKTIIVISNIDKNASDIKDIQKNNVNTNNSVSGIEKFIATGKGLSTVAYSWKQGYVHGENYSNPLASTNTLYSELFDAKPFSLNVSVLTGYKVVIVSFNADGSWVRTSDWLTGNDNKVTITTKKYCIEARKSDNSDLTPSVGAIADIEWVVKDGASAIFVSTSGNDSNDGLTRATPLKTIQKAISAGAKNILVKEGTYNETVTLTDLIGISIRLDPYYSSFSAGTDEDNPKIIIDGQTTRDKGVVVTRCMNCSFADIEVKNTNSQGFNIVQSTGLRFDDCIAHDIGTTSPTGAVGGFVITYTDADFYNCVVYNIGTTTAGTGAYLRDGFNIHGTGTTNFINCKGWNCEDDGISHHDACCGLIDGGEWYNCGKGGISSPTHGAKVNVQNVYSHDNKYGLYAGNDSAVTDRGNILVANCVFKNNSISDLYANNYYKIIAMNCILDTHQGQNITMFNQ